MSTESQVELTASGQTLDEVEQRLVDQAEQVFAGRPWRYRRPPRVTPVLVSVGDLLHPDEEQVSSWRGEAVAVRDTA